jgi:hypothetical protein
VPFLTPLFIVIGVRLAEQPIQHGVRPQSHAEEKNITRETEMDRPNVISVTLRVWNHVIFCGPMMGVVQHTVQLFCANSPRLFAPNFMMNQTAVIKYEFPGHSKMSFAATRGVEEFFRPYDNNESISQDQV